ncbi:MAG: hypothetical protein ACRBBW_20865 [Cellvibrionaceae bacterium]
MGERMEDRKIQRERQARADDRNDELFDMKKQSHQVGIASSMRREKREDDIFNMKMTEHEQKQNDRYGLLMARQAAAIEGMGDQLTDEDRDLLNQHPIVSAQYLSSPEFKQSADVARRVIKGELSMRSPDVSKALNYLLPELKGQSKSKVNGVHRLYPGREPGTVVVDLDTENGIQPMTVNRTSDENDLVKQIPVENMIRKIQSSIQMSDLMQSARGRQTLIRYYGLEPKAKKPDTELGKLIAARDKLPEGHENRALYDSMIAKKTSLKAGITISKDGTVQIGGEGSALGTPAENESQKRVISGGESLARLQTIRENYNPKFLTYSGKKDRWLSALKSKADIDLSSDERDMLTQHRKFSQSVNYEFNAYRKLITGAAAAVAELEDLKKAMISEDLSPVEFEAAFETYSDELKRTIRIRSKLLREGIHPGTKQYGERLDQMYLSGGDDDVDSRGAELEAQGKSSDQIVAVLESEGYL